MSFCSILIFVCYFSPAYSPTSPAYSPTRYVQYILFACNPINLIRNSSSLVLRIHRLLQPTLQHHQPILRRRQRILQLLQLTPPPHQRILQLLQPTPPPHQRTLPLRLLILLPHQPIVRPGNICITALINLFTRSTDVCRGPSLLWSLLTQVTSFCSIVEVIVPFTQLQCLITITIVVQQ